jgi:hypothetical protein
MIRKIVDYQKLNENLLNLLVEKFPFGYDEDDIITYRNSKNEIVEAVEVRTEDAVYLVKVGLKLIKAMEDFENEDINQDDEKEISDDVDLNSMEIETDDEATE